MENIYLIISTIIILGMGIIWNKKDFPNFFVKTILLLVGIAGLVIVLAHYGYIIKVN
jgi:hypothetical protein